MELGGVPEKMDEYFHWGPIFYDHIYICVTYICVYAYIYKS